MNAENLAILEELYEQYTQNPTSVAPEWQTFFAEVEQDGNGTHAPSNNTMPKMVFTAASADIRVFNLIQAYRTYGHLLAKFNPIDTHPKTDVEQLNPSNFGFSPREMEESFPSCGILAQAEAPLKEIIDGLQQIYSGRIGVEYMGLQRPEMEQWLQQRIEPTRFQPNLTIEEKRSILKHLNKSELFEVFLHTKYVGQKRFSLEGGETLIPILSACIASGSNLGLEEFYIGLAHRGRLNVLANILNKAYSDIFHEFEDAGLPGSFEGSGDVKYHKGYLSELTSDSGKKVRVSVTANPSHLEAVNAVVEGQVRARQVMRDDAYHKVVPILIHGDAAVAGQGVVYETMQLFDLPGYRTGGTIHFVINNQIGFTTLPKDARSTRYCTDIARSFGAPVFHVNAEDPEGCVYATQLAIEIRQRFHCDVFIELNCFRKYGHNEGDEPAFTQPLEYQLIRKKKSSRELYRDELIQQGVLEREIAEQLEQEFRSDLQKAQEGTLERVQQAEVSKEIPDKKPQELSKHVIFSPVDTKVSVDDLQMIAEKFCTIPESFNIHRKLKRLIEDRCKMVKGDIDAQVIDWGMGEHLAFATLLWEGRHVRLSGQDSRRGTFSHRHAMWMDQKAERKYFPLNHLKEKQGRFDVFNSPLSEYAVLGFEFGYSLCDDDALVMWEAQFGDFSNGAQIIIDQFIATAEMKWGSQHRTTMLLPHGYEGQGPEHSSARIERFLQLSGDFNMQVVNPSSPAQLFHLLRRQVHAPWFKPLIVFTPKGLLRLPACTSSLREFSEGSFQEIIDDVIANKKKVKRLAFCSGKVYYDLLEGRKESARDDVAIVRIEQMYPLYTQKLEEIISQYPAAKEIVWVQEEPSNMAGWDYIAPTLQKLCPKGSSVHYIGRTRSASPAVGSFRKHKLQQAQIVSELFQLEPLSQGK